MVELLKPRLAHAGPPGPGRRDAMNPTPVASVMDPCAVS
jgi:hypothetical protein